MVVIEKGINIRVWVDVKNSRRVFNTQFNSLKCFGWPHPLFRSGDNFSDVSCCVDVKTLSVSLFLRCRVVSRSVNCICECLPSDCLPHPLVFFFSFYPPSLPPYPLSLFFCFPRCPCSSPVGEMLQWVVHCVTRLHGRGRSHQFGLFVSALFISVAAK